MRIELIGYLYERQAFSLHTKKPVAGWPLMPVNPHGSSPAWVSASVDQGGHLTPVPEEDVEIDDAVSLRTARPAGSGVERPLSGFSGNRCAPKEMALAS
jgi:hypothetical protein